METRKVVGGIALFAGLMICLGQVALAQPCEVPDNGSGTVNLPPIGGPGCGYLSPQDVHEIIAGLPPGTTIILGAEHSRFANVIVTPGGPLGGEHEQFNSEIFLHLEGTGDLAGYVRNVNMTNVQVQTDTAPRGSGSPQIFATDLAGMQGQLPPGDPDFDLLRITAGTNFGMPSGGQTTLTQLGPPGSNWQVDSFFDITYRIDFIGAPGGPLGGMSGSTTGTIRMQTGTGGFCCLPNGTCQPMPGQLCLAQGGSPVDHCPPNGQCVPRGDDCFFTQCGQTQFDFCDNPIPSDFFNPGSEPFDGPIYLQGASPTTPDTIVRRNAAALLDGPPETIPIELVQLHLTSCKPIVVNSSSGPSAWNVNVQLSPAPVPPGHVTILKTHANGGVFDASFPVQPLFIFSEVGNPGNIRVLDTAGVMPPTDFATTGPAHWVHNASVPTPPCGVNFVPGVQEDPATGEQCCTETCHDNPGGGHKHCTKRCFVCPRGACCDPASNSCFIADPPSSCGGVYMGDGTNCNDADNDGLADVFELNDCCQPSSPCRVASNPNNPDTDGDGVLDGNELLQGCDPCVPDCGVVACCLPLGACAIMPPTACQAQGGIPADSACQGDPDGDGIDNACDIPPCGECGPGEHWIDETPCPVGDPNINGQCKVSLTNCASNEDCQGQCRLSGANCATDADCAGQCRISMANCFADSDCVGQCQLSLTNCTQDAHCTGVCQPSGTASCLTNADCTGAGEVCTGRVCLGVICDGNNCDGNVCNKPGAIGQDNVPSGAVFGIDTNLDGIADVNAIAGGPVTIRKRGPFDTAPSYPAFRPADGHKDVIDTEIMAMSLTGGGVTLRAGTFSGSVVPLQATRGAIGEKPNNPSLADSFFDVFFEVDLGGVQYYNQSPVRVAQEIECVPPHSVYYHISGVTPLYTSPNPGQGVHAANLVAANHFTYPACCSTAFPGGCAPNVPVAQCPGTVVPACLGDSNFNGIDDACDPRCEVDPGSPTGCTQSCPPPAPAGTQCLPSAYGCIGQGQCGVIECDCTCHLVFDATGPNCQGFCPDVTESCRLSGTGALGDPFRCSCEPDTTVCEPNAAGTDCNPVNCPPDPTGLPQVCRKKCAKVDAAGNVVVTDCDCQPDQDCYLELASTGGRGIEPGADGGVAGGAGGCIVADNGSGTVNLPPLDLECGYLSPDDVHEIIDGLPPGTTVILGAQHHRFANVVVTPGGSLGGDTEQFTSEVLMELQGTGDLAGYNRIVNMANVSVETHTAPRGIGPVQSFDTDMFLMQGQLPPGDPDFDLLRITAGSGFGLPSPGHTTLSQLPGGNWAVDSFFDIFYRIDFIGAPGGPLGGMSGSTTGTIRMQTGSPFKCVGDCPPGTQCEQSNVPQPDGTNIICCDCVPIPQDCAPNAAGTDCNPVTCPPDPNGLPQICRKQCVRVDIDGNIIVTDCECQPDQECYMELASTGGRSVEPEFDGGVAGGPNGCVVPDDAGTVDLPPAGCDYLSPDDVHMIIDGLPPGTTINLAPIHTQIFCHEQNNVCSFPPGVECEQPGGSLGGEKECAMSVMQFQAQCVGPCPGGLAGWNRPISVPVGFETHVAPRNPGDPVQSFDTEMFRLFGQITGDPDFDLLRVVGGTDFGLPSPGHTTLTQLPGGNWAVDSFFDITYRIDFVGAPGGPLGGMSGSTTGTIRMQTGAPFKCRGDCPPGTRCVQTSTPEPDGSKRICCECVEDEPPGACCLDDGSCINTTQANCQGTFLPGQLCSGSIEACCDPSGISCTMQDRICCLASGGTPMGTGTNCSGIQTACCLPGGAGPLCVMADPQCCTNSGGTPVFNEQCTGDIQGCCLPNGLCEETDPVCCRANGGVALGSGNHCAGDLDGNGADDACERCEPNPDGTGCTNFCPPSPIQEACLQRCAEYDPQTGEIRVTACDCRRDSECHLVYPGGGASRDDEGGVAGGPNGCVVPDNGSGTVTLPPPGCDYLSPSQVHMIIDGLPPGTTIQLQPIHSQIFCRETNNVCSFPPGVDCEDAGGTLGGQKECNASTMQFQATCTGTCPGGLAGFNRPILIPDVGFETHLAPRGAGPSQSFDTDMFRLFGQITGDPDFDLLRIVAGTDFGLPSPGHTTLTQLPGGNWAVDSFFDITYRIDFVGAPGGPLAGMSGSTTGTIRMGTTPPFKCVGGCPPRRICTPRLRMNPNDTVTVCCDCRPRRPIGDPTGVNKSRFISFAMDSSSVVAGTGDEAAIRVRLVSLHHVVPPYTGGPSIPFTAFEGEVRYAGPPGVYLESGASGIRFVASQLQCGPHYRDWTTFSSCNSSLTLCTVDADCPMGGVCNVPLDPLIHLTGSAMTPSSVYEVEVLGSSCMGMEDTCGEVSDPLEARTTRWADVEVSFNPPANTAQPDASDIAALVNKFRGLTTAIIKARALIMGSDAGGNINLSPDLSFIHIAACVDAFRGLPYPFSIQACP